MKVKLLPLAIGAAIAMPGVAMADTNFYGKINLAYGMSDRDPANGAESADRWDLNSYDSRFGVKGSEDITDSLKAIYGIEWGVSIDGDDSEMSQRNRFVGVEAGFGTLTAGRFDTPLKTAQGKIDLFGDTTGDIKYIFLGENRKSDILQYASPDMGGFVATVAWMPGEEWDNGTGDPDSSPADAISASVTFSTDNLYVAVAQDLDMGSSFYAGIDDVSYGFVTSGSLKFDTTRLVGVFKMDAFQLGAMYQMASTSDADIDGDIEQDGFLVSGSFKLDAIVLKAQVGTIDVDLDGTLMALGADYVLSKQTNFYAHYTTVAYEVDNADEQTADKIDFGVVHKF